MSNTKDLLFFLAFFRCEEPVTVTIAVKVENVEWSHVFTSGDELPVPGLTLGSLVKAGLYVKVELQEGDRKLTLKVWRKSEFLLVKSM